jgi:hypothetical protein
MRPVSTLPLHLHIMGTHHELSGTQTDPCTSSVLHCGSEKINCGITDVACRGRPYLLHLSEDLHFLQHFPFMQAQFAWSCARTPGHQSPDPWLLSLTPNGIPLNMAAILTKRYGQLDRSAMRLQRAINTSASAVSRWNERYAALGRDYQAIDGSNVALPSGSPDISLSSDAEVGAAVTVPARGASLLQSSEASHNCQAQAPIVTIPLAAAAPVQPSPDASGGHVMPIDGVRRECASSTGHPGSPDAERNATAREAASHAATTDQNEHTACDHLSQRTVPAGTGQQQTTVGST